MKKRFPRSIDSLAGIFRFVADFLAAENVAESNRFEVDFIIEELFTNQVKYANGPHDILVELGLTGDMLTISVTDFDVDPFDPTRAAPVDVDLPLEKRRPGGLGIHLIKSMADDIRYDYRDRQSTVTVTKRMDT